MEEPTRVHHESDGQSQHLPGVPVLSESDAHDLVDALADAGFTEAQLPRLYGLETMAQMKTLSAEDRERAASGDANGHTLVSVFLHGKAVPAESLGFLGDLARWTGAGLLRSTANGVIATVNLVPFMGLLIASDRPRTPDGVRWVHPDHVMGVGGSSLTLASLTIRRPVARALDLGCGCGVHALLAARHAERVLATDLNERAIEFTRLNATINGLANIEAITGDLYEPAGEAAFGLIVSNPPFVISPETSFVYRDSPLPGDQLVERVVRGAASRLEPGGHAAILANWIHPDGGSWEDRLRGWISPSGCDGLVMQSMASSGTEYAQKWLSHTGSSQSIEQATAAWTSYFDEQRIAAIGSGLIVLHRPTDARAAVFVPAHAPDDWTADANAGEHLARLIAAAAWLDRTSDATLLDTPLSMSPEARITHELAPGHDGSGWDVEQATMRLRTGLAARARLDGFTSQLVMALDGHSTAASVIEGVADMLGVAPEEARRAAPRVLRGMIGTGYIQIPATA